MEVPPDPALSGLPSPPRPRRAPGWALLGLLALALALRLAGWSWGLPGPGQDWSFHPDEYRLADSAQHVVAAGTLDPGRFQYGSLAVYLPALAGWPGHALFGAEGPRYWHRVGRGVSLAFGLLAILAVFRLAELLAGPLAGWFAGLAMALAPGPVLLSGYATPDAPAAGLTALCLWLAVAALERPRSWRQFAALGALAGLAAAVKYSAGLVLVAVWMSAWWAPSSVSDRHKHPILARLLAATLASALAFAAAMPYAFVDFAQFRKDLVYELIQHPRAGHGNLFVGSGDGWSQHLLQNFPYLLGWPLLLASLIGLGLLATRAGRGGLLLAAFFGIGFALLGTSKVRFMRYLLPLVPVLCVGFGVGIETLGQRSGTRRLLGVVAALVLAYAGFLSLLQGRALQAVDPRLEALAAAKQLLPVGTEIGLAVQPAFFHPPFTSANGGPRLRTRFLKAIVDERVPWRFSKPTGFDKAALESTRAEAFVLSEFDWTDGVRLADRATLEFLSALDARFKSRLEFIGIPQSQRWLFDFGLRPPPHDWLYPFESLWLYR